MLSGTGFEKIFLEVSFHSLSSTGFNFDGPPHGKFPPSTTLPKSGAGSSWPSLSSRSTDRRTNDCLTLERPRPTGGRIQEEPEIDEDQLQLLQECPIIIASKLGQKSKTENLDERGHASDVSTTMQMPDSKVSQSITLESLGPTGLKWCFCSVPGSGPEHGQR